MSGTRADRVLRDWDAVANRAVRPAAAPRPDALGRRAGARPGLLPLMAGAIAVAMAVAWLGGHEDPGVGTPDRSASAPASAIPVTPAPEASNGPGALCPAERLAVAVNGWDGAAGSRTATLSLRLTGARSCTIERLWRPQLIDGSGRVRLEGATVRDPGTIELRAGEVLTTHAQAGNDCSPPAVAPVTIAFVLGDGSRVVATPLSSDDVTTPPCNGPGEPGTMSMQPWTR